MLKAEHKIFLYASIHKVGGVADNLILGRGNGNRRIQTFEVREELSVSKAGYMDGSVSVQKWNLGSLPARYFRTLFD
jgi:hypothetical protein